MKIKTNLSIGAVLLTGLFLSACSQESSGNIAGQQVQGEPVAEAKTRVKGVAHTHSANECTNSISHTHPNGGSVHKHRYSCKPKMSRAANEHKHPANKCTRSVSHAHPNDKREHAHRYSCQSNTRVDTANGHFHPANSMTRSTRHSHPNGKSKHSHHYAM